MNIKNPDITYIYALCDPDTEIVNYIGKTDRLEGRLEEHLQDKNNSYKVHWINALKNLKKLPKMIVLEEVNKTHWREAEKKWVAHYRPITGDMLTNATNGGNTTYFDLPLEARKKIDEITKKQDNSQKKLEWAPVAERLKLSKAAKFLNVVPLTLRRGIKAGRIPFFKSDTNRLFIPMTWIIRQQITPNNLPYSSVKETEKTEN